MNGDGRIESRDLCSSSVIERVLSDESVSSIKIAKTIQSDNYSAGVSGWQINKDTGSCEFQDATIRGTLNASDITAGSIDASTITITNLDADEITAGTLAVARIGSNSIDTSKIELTAALETGQVIRSSTYTPGSAGWSIEADGSAEFSNVVVRGTIDAGAGSDIDWSYISNVSIVNADIANLSADKITAGTLNIARIGTNDITTNKLELSAALVASQFLSSTSYSAGVSGWKISADGSAEFNDVTVRGDLTSTDGTRSIVIDSSTWAGTPRIQIDNGTYEGRITQYSDYMRIESDAGASGARIDLSTSGDPSGADASIDAGSGGQVFLNGDDVQFVQSNGNLIVDDDGASPSTLRIYRSTATGTVAMSGGSSISNGGAMYLYGGSHATLPSEVRFSHAGTLDVQINGVSGYMTAGHRTTGGWRLKIDALGSAGAPDYAFYNDPNTGMYRYTADTIGFAANSAARLWISATQIRALGSAHFVDAAPNNVGGSATAIWTSIGGGAYRLDWTGSSRRFKKNIARVDLADIVLTPRSFNWKSTGVAYVGFIAEELASQDSRLGSYDHEGQVQDFDTRGVLAVMASKINRLEEQVAEMRSAAA